MPGYAVILRTHFWDDFVARQLARLRSVAKSGDVFVMLDETAGGIAGVTHERIVRITESEILDMGFAKAGQGALLWFNGDYPLYRFRQLFPQYAYYVQLEYDVVITADLDRMIDALERGGTDFVGCAKAEQDQAWHWLPTTRGVYAPASVRHELICLSIFSNRALSFLHDQRLRMSRSWQQGELAAWPYCEAFIPTELGIAGFKSADLGSFGGTQNYDHWPPLLERDLDETDGTFLHPVLDDARYAASLLKYRIGLVGYLWPQSAFHRRARRLPLAAYARLVAGSFADKAARTLRHIDARTKEATS